MGGRSSKQKAAGKDAAARTAPPPVYDQATQMS